MTIHQLAERLDKKALSDNFAVAQLSELRKKYLGKKRLPHSIFSQKTIFDGENKYAFHHGGRDEIQFNVGEEYINDNAVTRLGLCFSLEPSPSLHHPVEDLEQFRQKFNDCFEKHPEFFAGFEMWYYQNGLRNGNFAAQRIPKRWFQHKAFICLGSIIQKPLSELNDSDLTKILSEFDKLLPIYRFCVLESLTASSSNVRIFTRLTSNENYWELPSPHRWRKENQGKKNIAFENQYGFGHEEWLLNPRYNLNGYQYGYIRGIENSKEAINCYNEVHLYTVKREEGKSFVYYLGFIKNLFVIKNDVEEQNKINKVIERYKPDMVTEVESINVDIAGIIKFPIKAIVKFKLGDALFFDEPIYQPKFDLEKYKRFQPYQVKGSIDDIFESYNEEIDLGFVSGKSSQTNRYNRKNKESTVSIEKVHTEIVEALENFLKPKYSLSLKNLSIETMRFNRNIADVVTKQSETSITIYEVKTSSSGRRNIRDAIAQLLDYALHTSMEVEKLIIVSPSSLNTKEVQFLEGLKKKINYPLEYLCYSKSSNEKFITQ